MQVTNIYVAGCSKRPHWFQQNDDVVPAFWLPVAVPLSPLWPLLASRSSGSCRLQQNKSPVADRVHPCFPLCLRLSSSSCHRPATVGAGMSMALATAMNGARPHTWAIMVACRLAPLSCSCHSSGILLVATRAMASGNCSHGCVDNRNAPTKHGGFEHPSGTTVACGNLFGLRSTAPDTL